MQHFGAVVKDTNEALAAIQKEAAAFGLALIRGRMVGVSDFESGFPRIAWKSGENNEWREFFRFAQSIGVKALVYDYDTVDMEELREDAEYVQDDSFPEHWIELTKLLNELQPYDGEIGHIGLMFHFENMVYQASLKAPWFDKYMQAQMMATDFEEFEEDDTDMYDIQ